MKTLTDLIVLVAPLSDSSLITLLQNDIHSTCCYTSKNQRSVLCASCIVDLDLQLGLTTACGLKVGVSSGSVSEISISCLGSVDSLRWRSLAKFSRGVGPSCLSSHAAGHSGRFGRVHWLGSLNNG